MLIIVGGVATKTGRREGREVFFEPQRQGGMEGFFLNHEDAKDIKEHKG